MIMMSKKKWQMKMMSKIKRQPEEDEQCKKKHVSHMQEEEAVKDAYS